MFDIIVLGGGKLEKEFEGLSSDKINEYLTATVFRPALTENGRMTQSASSQRLL